MRNIIRNVGLSSAGACLTDGSVAVRLGDRNNSILDNLLVPITGRHRDKIRFTEKDRARLGIDRFETSDALIRSVGRPATRPRRVSPTKPVRPNKRSEIKPVQRSDRPRAALIERRYR